MWTNARSERNKSIEMYFFTNFQACAYTIGMLKIRDLRTKATTQLGRPITVKYSIGPTLCKFYTLIIPLNLDSCDLCNFVSQGFPLDVDQSTTRFIAWAAIGDGLL